MRSSPSERPKELQRHRFSVPTTSKFVFAVILAAACLSIVRLQPLFNGLGINDFTTERALIVQSLLNEYYQVPSRRVVFIDGVPKWARNETTSRGHSVIAYPMQLRPLNDNSTDSDLTRYYPVGTSNDYPAMERRRWPNHEFDPHCIPSAKWQSEFHPVCNDIHATVNIREALLSGELSLLSNKGFWRHAWRYNQTEAGNHSSVTVWKTFKYVITTGISLSPTVYRYLPQHDFFQNQSQF
jgi:hypothetical protein